MKTLKVLIAVLMFVPALSMAQVSADVTFKSDEFGKSYTALVGDTVRGVTSKAKTFQIDKPWVYDYQYQLRVDSLTDGGSVNIIMAGSLDGTTYWNIDTVSWAISAANTTVLFTNRNGVLWKYLRGTVYGVGATTRVRLRNHSLRVAEHK